MRDRQILWSVLVPVLLLSHGLASGDWGPIVQLSYTDSASRAGEYGPPLVAKNQMVHAIWADYHAGTRCLVYSRSTDQGTDWSTAVPLTGWIPNRYAFAYGYGSNIHLVYDSSAIRYRRSSDNGASWSSSESLTCGIYFAFGSNGQGSVFLAYQLNYDSVQVKRSTDDGVSWSGPIFVGCSSSFYWGNTVVADYPPYVYLCFCSHDSVLVTRSTNSGSTWEPARAVVVTSGLAANYLSFVADNGNRLHLTWVDNHTGNNEIYYTRSTDNGSSWEGTTRFTISNGSYLNWLCARDGMVFTSYYNSSTMRTRRRSFDGGATWEAESDWPTMFVAYSTNLAALGDGHWVHLLRQDYVYPSGNAITYYRSKDAGTSWPDSGVSVSAMDNLNRYPRAIAISGGDVHTLWEDYETGNYEIMYRRGIGLGGVEEAGPAEQQKKIAVEVRPSVVTTTTTISYAMPVAGPATISVYEMNGRLVKKWSLDRTLPGEHAFAWACQDAHGRRVGPGIYFCIIQVPAGTSRCRLVVL